ncbi:hypothetical protein UNH65_21305 [Chitinophaga sp. 180180018-2]|nr:hypothetical protein [Chitinophaga sp. 212800010-3]
MALFKYIIRISTVLLLICMTAGRSLAAIEPYLQKIQGSLKKGDTLIVKDEKFENPAYNWNAIRNNSVLNTIVFKLNNESLQDIKQSFSCKADLKVEYWSQPNQDQPITIEHVKLEINYDTAVGAVFQPAAQYDFSNAYKVKITINDISSQELKELPAIFTLQAQVVVNRDYLPQGSQALIPTVSLVQDPAPGSGSAVRAMAAIVPGANAVNVNWDLVPGAQKYDLEWTFVDEESANGAILAQSGTGTTAAVLATMFRNNSTRITVDGHSYTISLVNNNKYLLLRIRTVDQSTGLRTEGPWSYQIQSDGIVSSGVVTLPVSWHQPGLNWQYDATYAEDGKKKEVVSYFDGTLRNRQTVTASNTDTVSIVQENIYDQFGRPVANILPAPAGSGILTFFPAFNRNANGTAYTYNNIFRNLTGACIGLPDSLRSDTGAANYYSPRSRFLATSPFSKYTPDAEGYPFAVTSYTPDNTGRVAVKGGVGAAMQPNVTTSDNHTTRYYYGKPEQWELDRMFGSDAGFADHYLKNMVIDPNGQISISYVNSSGKTIATALTGNPPDTSLLALPSKPAPVKKSVVLLQPDRFVFDPVTLKLTATTTYLASVPDASASFTFSIDRLIKKYVQNGVTICSNCYYDVKVSMSNDCNQKILDISNIKRGSTLSDCNLTTNIDTTFTAPLNKIGEYYITFELALNKDVIENYTSDFISRNTNLKTQFQFVMEQLKKENFSSCFAECTTCRETLGARPDFMKSLKTRMQADGVDTLANWATIDSWTGGLYDALYSNCLVLRASCLSSPCDRLKAVLVQDVSPGGQFALFAADGTPLEANINVINQYWRTVFPASTPTTAQYEANKVMLPDGNYVTPYDPSFTLKDLLTYWQPQWGELFLAYHPERCALDFCNNNASYKTWDQRVAELWTSTADIPLIKAGLAYDVNNGSWLLNADPFFLAGGAGAGYQAEFKSELDNYSTRVMGSRSGMNVKHLSQYVDYRLYCANASGSTNTGGGADDIARWNQCAPVASCRVPDREWKAYVDLYLQAKEKYYQRLMDATTCNGKCKVGAATVIDPTNTPQPPVPYRTCADFNVSMFSRTGNRFPVTFYPPANIPIPPGLDIQLVLTLKNDPGYPIPNEWFVDFTAQNPGPQTIDLGPGYAITKVQLFCSGTPTNPPPACPVEYFNKQSRVNNTNYSETVSSNAAPWVAQGGDSLKTQIQRSCDAVIDNWIAKLAGCSMYTSLPAATQQTFRTRLTEICTLGGDTTHIYGSRTTLNGRTNTDGDASFDQVFRRYLGVSYTLTCNPWIMDAPYPANVKAQTVSREVGATDPDICTKLNALKQEQQSTQPGVTFYNFLASKFGSGMNISTVELDALLKGCNNCRYLLDRDIKLPAFLDGTAKGSITGAEFQAAKSDFTAALGAVNTQDRNYKNVFRNFMNLRFGFTLSYVDYDNYGKILQSNPSATLCNDPVYTSAPQDPYACVYSLVDGTISAANRMYSQYIDSVKQDFRQQYVNVCSGAHPKVTLNTSQQIYHYTLYYYDQAGNLLRTVPPEGVSLIEDTDKLDQIDRARRADFSQCSYNGPLNNTDPVATMDKLGTALTGPNQSVEMWLYNPDGGSTQVLANAGGKAYVNVCINGSYLNADIYKLSMLGAGTVDIPASNGITVNIASLLPLDQWTHVVLQGPDLDSSGIVSVFVNGVNCPVVNNVIVGDCGWDITSSPTSVTFGQNQAYVKQLRMYKRLLTSNEIAANAKEMCLGLAPAYSAGLLRDTIGWGRFNTPAPGSATTVPDQGTIEVKASSIYPQHRLTTDYAYNSLGQVVQQNSPDANTSYFWYDQKGRLVASVNANQYTEPNRYSYTKYDNQGRIVEVGEKRNTTNIGNPGFVPDATLQLFNNNGTKSQITKTTYDVPIAGITPQRNLRKRVSASEYMETDGTVEEGTYYSYDLPGNVETIWQKLYGLYEMKKIDYNYDLVSGKVNALRYQYARPDQFFYNYDYDAENRITKASSGIAHAGDGWKINIPATDAMYYYYKHGPLARTRIGDNVVQGVDYAYTLQGWLKAINGTHLSPLNEIGQDGQPGTRNSTFAKDAMAYTLDYYTGDYKPIGGTNANALGMKYASNTSDITGQNLFNGNISRTTVALSKFNSGNPVGYSYRYDQLNRLVRMRQHQPAGSATTWGLSDRKEVFGEDISYDGNGNILGYLRRGDNTARPVMDSLSYYYPRDAAGNLISNRLRHIRDTVSADAYQSDIDNMVVDNYGYDQIGNLVRDNDANIGNITWSIYGKIKSINFNDNSSLLYKYDAGGNRIYKEYTKSGVITRTWYVRDAQGNTLAVYGNKNGDNGTYWKEQHLYGSSRLGMWLPEMSVTGAVGNASVLWNQGNLKRYELSNHLGNEMAVISDQQASGNATVYNMTDYAPFGMQMVGRKWSAAGGYRYGFNGKENDNEVKGEGNQQDYGFRIYDPRVGRFLSVDPLSKKYPWYTPYQFAGNTPIQAIDLDGAEEWMMQQAFATKRKAELKIAQAEQIARDKTRILTTIPENHIMMKIDGVIQMGPESVVLRNAAIAKQRYDEALASSITGPFGAAGYLIGGDESAFKWSTVDHIMMSFGGIPAGNSSVFPHESEIGPARFTPYTEARANRFFGKLDPLVRTVAEAIENSMPNSVLAVEREIKDQRTGRTLTDFDIELNNYIIEVNNGSATGKFAQIRDRIQPHTNKEVILFSPKMGGSVEKSMKANNIRAFRDLKSLIEYVTPKQK